MVLRSPASERFFILHTVHLSYNTGLGMVTLLGWSCVTGATKNYFKADFLLQITNSINVIDKDRLPKPAETVWLVLSELLKTLGEFISGKFFCRHRTKWLEMNKSWVWRVRVPPLLALLISFETMLWALLGSRQERRKSSSLVTMIPLS